MSELKRISPEAIPSALEKAERYRLLNEPAEAESICLDVLAIDPDNQKALVMLLLALTDQFQTGPVECFRQAQAVVPRLQGEYERHYYSGILWERRGHARLSQGGPGSGAVAQEWLRKAMGFYEKAEAVRPAGNDDALLRWNTCVRLHLRHHLEPEAEREEFQPALEDY
jgi:hypothetical protein